MSAKRKILNPGQEIFTPQEQAFIQETQGKSSAAQEKSGKTKSRNISMRDEIWDRMTLFIQSYPSEGSHSGVISRAVSDYIRKKETEYRNA